LFSIRPEYANAIFSGVKKFELRRAGPEIEQGSVAVVYASGRVQRIYGFFYIGRVLKGPPDEIWRLVTSRKDSGVTKEAKKFIEGSRQAMAIEVVDPRPFQRRPSLREVRLVLPSWNPPLSYVELSTSEPVFKLFLEPLLEEAGALRRVEELR